MNPGLTPPNPHRDRRGALPAGPGAVAPGPVKPRILDRNASPVGRPGEPDRAPNDLIPIPLGPSSARPSHTTPWEFWSNYYKPNPDPKKDHDESSANLRETVALLNWNKKFADAQAALVAYLTYRSKGAEPWMYEALALAIKENRGKEQDVRTALNYAADLAERSHNPNLLVSVADQLYLNGDFDRIGALLDEAAEKVPHRAEPLIMAINLAQRTNDPKRMAAAVDRLLALGWPGGDEHIRREARLQVERLAKTLREEGRAAEADALLAMLPEAEARDLFVRLTWTGDADLDLVVDEPLGATAQYRTPRTVFGGSIIKNGYGKHPEEVYVCPRAFDGDYTIRIDIIYNDSKIRDTKDTEQDPERPATRASLEIITHEGTSDEHKEMRTIPMGDKPPAPVVVHLQGGRRKSVLPFLVQPNIVPPARAGAPGSRTKHAEPKPAKPKP
jgi:hypothetical protein